MVLGEWRITFVETFKKQKMKKFILKYGLYSAALIIGLFSISFMTMDTIGMAAQEIFGYLSIFLALVFVFFGVKAYRDKERSGSIKFGRALGVGDANYVDSCDYVWSDGYDLCDHN